MRIAKWIAGAFIAAIVVAITIVATDYVTRIDHERLLARAAYSKIVSDLQMPEEDRAKLVVAVSTRYGAQGNEIEVCAKPGAGSALSAAFTGLDLCVSADIDPEESAYSARKFATDTATSGLISAYRRDS